MNPLECLAWFYRIIFTLRFDSQRQQIQWGREKPWNRLKISSLQDKHCVWYVPLHVLIVSYPTITATSSLTPTISLRPLLPLPVHQAAKWLGVSDIEVELLNSGNNQDDITTAVAAGSRSTFQQGLGAKFLPHHKAISLTMGVEQRLRSKIKSSAVRKNIATTTTNGRNHTYTTGGGGYGKNKKMEVEEDGSDGDSDDEEDEGRGAAFGRGSRAKSGLGLSRSELLASVSPAGGGGGGKRKKKLKLKGGE